MENLISLVAVDGVDLVTIVDGVVTKLVLDSGQLGAGLEGQRAKTRHVLIPIWQLVQLSLLLLPQAWSWVCGHFY